MDKFEHFTNFMIQYPFIMAPSVIIDDEDGSIEVWFYNSDIAASIVIDDDGICWVMLFSHDTNQHTFDKSEGGNDIGPAIEHVRMLFNHTAREIMEHGRNNLG